MLILLLHSNFLQLMDISFYIFGFVTIMCFSLQFLVFHTNGIEA
jgi:hypothetical protein